MADRFWVNVMGGSWFNPDNWDNNLIRQVPGNNDDALIDKAGSYTVTLDATTDGINSLTINNAAAILSIGTNGSLNITGKSGTDQLSLKSGAVDMTGAAAINALTIVFGGSSGILHGS